MHLLVQKCSESFGLACSILGMKVITSLSTSIHGWHPDSSLKLSQLLKAANLATKFFWIKNRQTVHIEKKPEDFGLRAHAAIEAKIQPGSHVMEDFEYLRLYGQTRHRGGPHTKASPKWKLQWDFNAPNALAHLREYRN